VDSSNTLNICNHRGLNSTEFGMAASAEEIRATRHWNDSPFDTRQSTWLERLRDNRGLLGFVVATSLLLIGWLSREREYFSADNGPGYFLGIVSAACMVVLLVYPLRKRFRILKLIGPLPKWFKIHMTLGVSAPIFALYHANFQIGSLVSRIALFSALFVAGSGLIGRFIYSKIHRGLYGRKTNLKELLARVKLNEPGNGILGELVPGLMKKIAAFDRAVLVPPKGVIDSMKLAFTLAFRTRLQRLRLMRFTRQLLSFHGARSPTVALHSAKLEKAVEQYLKSHLWHVRRVAEFTAYERLFSLWHKVHFPFFVALLVTVVVHVLAVQLY
jgi:hypothetical protein